MGGFVLVFPSVFWKTETNTDTNNNNNTRTIDEA